MHHACALQRLHLVQLYLSCLDFDINAKDCEGNTCLHYAAIAGNFRIVLEINILCPFLSHVKVIQLLLNYL